MISNNENSGSQPRQFVDCFFQISVIFNCRFILFILLQYSFVYSHGKFYRFFLSLSCTIHYELLNSEHGVMQNTRKICKIKTDISCEHEIIFLLMDNDSLAHLHMDDNISKIIRQTATVLNWEVLTHLSNFSDISPTDHRYFCQIP